MTFTVYDNSSAPLLTTTSYLEARRRWSEYLSTISKPTGLAGIDALSKGGEFKVDTRCLDRMCGFGTNSEREPSQLEALTALFF